MKKNSKIRIVLALLLSISLMGGFESLVFANSNKPIDLGVSDVIITGYRYIVDEDMSSIKLPVEAVNTNPNCIRSSYYSDCKYKYYRTIYSFWEHVYGLGSKEEDQKNLADITKQLLHRNTMKTALKKKNIKIKGSPYEKTISIVCSSLANYDLICTVTFEMNESNFLQGFFGQTNRSKANYQLKIPICRIDSPNTLTKSSALSICKARISKQISPQSIQKKPVVPTKNKTLKPVVIKKK